MGDNSVTDMKARLVLVLVLCLVSLCGCTRDRKARITRRIASVEHGLIGSYGNHPWARMDLAQRMAHYRVPGVSIAVINDWQIE